MSFTYNNEDAVFLSSALGLIRTRITDVDPTNPIFSDEQLTAFYGSEGNNWRLGAALALETIATYESLVQKVIKILQLTVDGAKLASELRAQAKTLRDQAAALVPVSTASEIDIAENVVDVFSLRQWIVAEGIRSVD